MPFQSTSQQKWMWANHPEMAKEWQEHTPKGKHLPKHVKKSHDLGIEAALSNFKLAGDELRLKLDGKRKYHGYEAALRTATENGHKKAYADVAYPPPAPPPAHDPQAEAADGYGDKRDADQLAEMLDQLDTMGAPGDQKEHKDPLDRSTHWGPPTNPAGGDTGSRVVDSGGPSGAGMAF
jgi:hypothetical protein